MLLVIALLSLPALALDADTYDPAGSTLDGLGGLQVEAPGIGTPGDWYAGLQLVYAANPVVVLDAAGAEEPWVNGIFATRLGGGYTIGETVRLDLDVPLYPLVDAEPAGFSGFAMGDIRVGGLLPVLRQDNSPVAVGFKPYVALPTASEGAYVGPGGFSAGLVASAGIKVEEQLEFTANLGTRLAPSESAGDYSYGSTFDYGIGAQYILSESWRFGAEFDGAIGLADGPGAFNKNPLELHGYGSYHHESGFLGTLGMGSGLVAGVGAPDFRLVIAAGWHHGSPPDKDKDGIPDKEDKCADRAEDIDNFKDSDGCPDLDNDGDGVADAIDQCRDVAEDTDGWKDQDGCPEPDNDGDGLGDGEDDCPEDAGPESTGGCPDKDKDNLADRDDQCPNEAGTTAAGGCPDGDSDGVPDKRDACPTQPKDAREDAAKSDGCPKKVVVTAQRIELNESIYFDTGKTTVKAVSFALLDEIARVMTSNPQIKKLEVGGHTDNEGDDAKNLKLSAGRAEAVVKYLIEKGKIDASRLSAVGYGETKPIDTNQTEAGRSRNRRVDLVIRD